MHAVGLSVDDGGGPFNLFCSSTCPSKASLTDGKEGAVRAVCVVLLHCKKKSVTVPLAGFISRRSTHETLHGAEELAAEVCALLRVVVDANKVNGAGVVREVFLVLVQVGHVGGEEHLDLGGNLFAGLGDGVPALFEIRDGARVGAVGEVIVDFVSKAQTDFNALVGELLHDGANSLSLGVVVGSETLPATSGHDRRFCEVRAVGQPR